MKIYEKSIRNRFIEQIGLSGGDTDSRRHHMWFLNGKFMDRSLLYMTRTNYQLFSEDLKDQDELRIW